MKFHELPELVQKCLEYGVEVSLVKPEDSNTVGYQVGGFYKSGTVTVFYASEEHPAPDGMAPFVAHARYGEKTDIYDFGDLVRLNQDWHQRSADRFEGWSQPDKKWAAAYREIGSSPALG